MTPKQWLALLAFYISYLFFGASVFYHFEHNLETERRAIALQNQLSINDLLIKSFKPMDYNLEETILDEISEYCEKSVKNYSQSGFVKPYIWNFYHSFFFAFTVCSTVGYGNISPNNDFGRIFMMFYALIGIPVNGILFAYLGECFGSTFTNLYKRYRAYKRNVDVNYRPKKIHFLSQIALYLIPGVVLFMFIPACLFTYFEEWDFTISVYYAFVTLTTIGFGDFVPTFQPEQEQTFGIYFFFYQVFIIVWFISGLGYLVMIMGFLAKGMRSKKIAKIEKQLAENIRDKNDKLWHNMQKDMDSFRKVFNELYLLKYKPSSKLSDFNDIFRKSASCPDLLFDQTSNDKNFKHRALSEATWVLTQKNNSKLSRSDNELRYDNLSVNDIIETVIHTIDHRLVRNIAEIQKKLAELVQLQSVDIDTH